MVRLNEIIAIFDEQFNLCEFAASCSEEVPVAQLQRVAKMAYVLEESVENFMILAEHKLKVKADPIYSPQRGLYSVGVYASFITDTVPRQLMLFETA